MTGEKNAPLRVPEVAALDIDHTFIDPDKAMQRLSQAITREGVALPPEILEIARQEARERRIPFSPLEIVRQHTTSQVFAAVRQRFHTEPCLDEQGKPMHLVYDDVARFEQLLQRHKFPRVFTTFGNDWQGDKLIADGFTENMVILPTPDKTAYFQALRHPSESVPEGEYLFAKETGYIATATLCVIDNSVDAFFPDFPSRSRGFCIRRGDRFPVDDPELQQKLPASVQIITSFDELTICNGVIVMRDPTDTPEEAPDDVEFVPQFIVPRIPFATWPDSLPLPDVTIARTASSHTLSTL